MRRIVVVAVAVSLVSTSPVLAGCGCGGARAAVADERCTAETLRQTASVAESIGRNEPVAMTFTLTHTHADGLEVFVFGFIFGGLIGAVMRLIAAAFPRRHPYLILLRLTEKMLFECCRFESDRWGGATARLAA